MILSNLTKLSDLKSDSSDLTLLYSIAEESGLYDLWLDDDYYKVLSNFMKNKFGIAVRHGYVFCKNDFACRIVIEFTSVSYKDVFVMKGLFE